MAYFEPVGLSRSGIDAAGAGTQNDLFLKVFSGEVLTTFSERNIFLNKTRMRTISSGKSA